MGNTVPPRASSSREATGAGRRRAGTGGRRSENVVVTEAASPATPPSRRVVTTACKQVWDNNNGGDVEKEGTARARRALRAGGADGAAPAAPAGRVVLTVKIVMTRKDAEALVARLQAQSARQRKARMAELEGELRAGSYGGGRGASRDARIRPMVLPPIKESRFEQITPAA